MEVGIKGTSVFIAQRFFFLFKSDLSILDSSCEMMCVFLTAKTLGTLMHESKFRSSVLLWRKCKFCFSSKVIGSVRDGRIMPFYSLDLTEWVFFFGEQDCRLGWQKARQLAAGGGGHFTQSWSVHLIPVLCSSGAVETLRGKTPTLHTQTLISFTSPMLCVPHPSTEGNACALYLLFVC